MKDELEEQEATDAQQDKDKSQQLVAPEEDPIPDQRLTDFLAKSEEEKDAMTCDEVFCMYLREISK